MEVQRIEERLWRWTTPHPEWKDGADWDRDVGCVYWEADDAVVLVDPLIPSAQEERERFLHALDRDVQRMARPVAIFLTCRWHERSYAELAARYDARIVGSPPRIGWLPQGVTPVDTPSAEEVVYWLAPVRTVVPGDTLRGTGDGLALCPESWLEGGGELATLRQELAPLLDLPVERVLTSHGPPVLADGRAALERALSG
jgi:glyoxylase-like metal-dependent hydrolase (beta-lactamase superfamily II)